MNDKEAPKRSPNYPSFSLEDSISSARTIYDRDRLAATSATVMVGHLGYNKLHGTSRRVLSAMKAYGLIDELSDNRYKVSDNAFKLFNSDLNSPKAIEMLREAALKPVMFRNVIEEYKRDLPSDQTLSSYLVLDKGFTPDGAQIFTKVLRENVEFANLDDDGFGENINDTPPHQENNMIGQHQQPPQSQPPPSAPVAPQNFNLPTPDTKETVLNFKISRKSEARIIFYGEDITQEAIDQLSKLLDTSKAVYPTQAELEEEKNAPKQAMWRNKDHDQPVTVTGELGEKDGKKFYSIAESSTGISEDELDFDGGGNGAGV